MDEKRCWCGHLFDWDHYHRTPGNGQRYDTVCVPCLQDTYRRLHDTTIEPWHKPQEER